MFWGELRHCHQCIYAKGFGALKSPCISQAKEYLGDKDPRQVQFCPAGVHISRQFRAFSNDYKQVLICIWHRKTSTRTRPE